MVLFGNFLVLFGIFGICWKYLVLFGTFWFSLVLGCTFWYFLVFLVLLCHFCFFLVLFGTFLVLLFSGSGATYISCKFDQQVGLLASVANLAIRWPCLLNLQIWPPGGATCIATSPWIALLASSVCIELVSSSARVTSVKSAQGL